MLRFSFTEAKLVASRAQSCSAGEAPQISTASAARHHLGGGVGGVRGVILDLSV